MTEISVTVYREVFLLVQIFKFLAKKPTEYFDC